MTIFHRALDKLADFLWTDRIVTMHFRADYRIARFALPLIQRLLADNEDGETYRCSIAQWTINERPTLHVHRGGISTLRIDGPLQNAGGTYLPLSGLIEAPQVTAHLDPIEADLLDSRVQEAIDRTLHEWIVKHHLYDQPRQCREIDRQEADREARAIIARWAANPVVKTATNAMPDTGEQPADCCPGEPDDGPCEACRKGPGHG